MLHVDTGMQTVYKQVPVIDPRRCTECGCCVDVCPNGCLSIGDGLASLAYPQSCLGDGICVWTCPQQAIKLKWLPVPVGKPELQKN